MTDTDTNYSPDEIRLLDEFAARWLQGEVSNGKCIAPFSKWAENSYDAAAAMIAERRKRVPSIDTTVRDLVRDLCAAGEKEFDPAPAQPEPEPGRLYPEPKCGKCGVAFLPGEPRVTPANMSGVEHVLCPPNYRVAQPQPEPDRGELTEEAVKAWDDDVRRYLLDKEADRAVALMREGLRAKRERDELLRLGRMTRQDGAECADSLMESADEIAALRARAEKAEAALAEAQPVLDAVAEFGWGAHEKACLARELLANYADRRRAEKGAK